MGRVDEILSSMDLDAKIGQMSQIDLSMIVEDDGTGKKSVSQSKIDYFFGEMGVGSILNNMVGEAWNATDYRRVMMEIQKVTAKTSRPPVIWGLDSVHGANYIHGATVLPQPLNLAATFNCSVAHNAGVLASRDTRAAGMNWLFAPLLGIAMEPKWSRVYETFGEDPFLVGEMATAMIKGIQKPNEGNPSRACACGKHFLGYSVPHNGHDRSPSWIPKRHLYQYFVPPWRKAIQHTKTVMEAYTEYDGVPNVANRDSLNRLLRKQLAFNGVLVTDYAEILNLYEWHHVVSSSKEAVLYALQEGTVDMSMIPFDAEGFRAAIHEGISNGRISMDRLDQSVERILRLKEELGMMDEQPNLTMDDVNLKRIGTDRQAALEITTQTITLVENKNNILPIPRFPDGVNVLITGPTANSLSYQSGGWTWQWEGVAPNTENEWFTYGTTVLQAAQNITSWHVTYKCGVNIEGHDCSGNQDNEGGVLSEVESWVGLGGGDKDSIADAADAAGKSDYVIVCIGEENYAEKPGDIRSLDLPSGQLELVRALANSNKDTKVVLVYFGGRPRLLGDIVDHVDAVFVGFLPGPDAGQALVDLIFGTANPSGRLPMTYPKYQDGYPYFHSVSDQCTNGTGPLPHFAYTLCDVQWPFGHGLGYTRFEYSDFQLSDEKILYIGEGQSHGFHRGESETLTMTVKVKNVGDRTGSETVLFFTFDEHRSVTPEYKRLRAFFKIELAPGEEQLVTADLSTYDPDFKFIGPHDDSHLIVEDGLAFRVGVGAAADCRREEGLCSSPVTVVTGEDYVASCDAACSFWATSPCAQEVGMSSQACWSMCSSGGEWGWPYVNCIESVELAGPDDCWKLTRECRDIFSNNNVPLYETNVPATFLALMAGLIASLIMVLSIRGDLFELWSRLRSRPVEFTPVDVNNNID